MEVCEPELTSISQLLEKVQKHLRERLPTSTQALRSVSRRLTLHSIYNSNTEFQQVVSIRDLGLILAVRLQISKISGHLQVFDLSGAINVLSLECLALCKHGCKVMIRDGYIISNPGNPGTALHHTDDATASFEVNAEIFSPLPWSDIYSTSNVVTQDDVMQVHSKDSSCFISLNLSSVKVLDRGDSPWPSFDEWLFSSESAADRSSFSLLVITFVPALIQTPLENIHSKRPRFWFTCQAVKLPVTVALSRGHEEMTADHDSSSYKASGKHCAVLESIEGKKLSASLTVQPTLPHHFKPIALEFGQFSAAHHSMLRNGQICILPTKNESCAPFQLSQSLIQISPSLPLWRIEMNGPNESTNSDPAVSQCADFPIQLKLAGGVKEELDKMVTRSLNLSSPSLQSLSEVNESMEAFSGNNTWGGNRFRLGGNVAGGPLYSFRGVVEGINSTGNGAQNGSHFFQVKDSNSGLKVEVVLDAKKFFVPLGLCPGAVLIWRKIFLRRSMDSRAFFQYLPCSSLEIESTPQAESILGKEMAMKETGRWHSATKQSPHAETNRKRTMDASSGGEVFLKWNEAVGENQWANAGRVMACNIFHLPVGKVFRMRGRLLGIHRLTLVWKCPETSNFLTLSEPRLQSETIKLPPDCEICSASHDMHNIAATSMHAIIGDGSGSTTCLAEGIPAMELLGFSSTSSRISKSCHQNPSKKRYKANTWEEFRSTMISHNEVTVLWEGTSISGQCSEDLSSNWIAIDKRRIKLKGWRRRSILDMIWHGLQQGQKVFLGVKKSVVLPSDNHLSMGVAKNCTSSNFTSYVEMPQTDGGILKQRVDSECSSNLFQNFIVTILHVKLLQPVEESLQMLDVVKKRHLFK